jgi:tRNA 2-selenouridine synthase
MIRSDISPQTALSLLAKGATAIDVRAPVEFARGSLSGATNLPIMNDDERSLVGHCYKTQGTDAATELGYQLVSKDVKSSRIDAWVNFLKKNPESLLFCARGGQRSQIASDWISEAGLKVKRIQGGFKALRGLLLPLLTPNAVDLVILGGSTGVGKTEFLREDLASIDLEALARHRGSAFGAHLDAQPAQITFENGLAMAFYAANHLQRMPTFLEDEGRMIGRIHVPPSLQSAMRAAPLVVLEADIERRVDRIFREYVLAALESYRELGVEQPLSALGERLAGNLIAIRKRLGHERHQSLSFQLHEALSAHALGDDQGHKIWIRELLAGYYDPMYNYQLSKKKERIVFRGDLEEVRMWRSSNVRT